jgi:hypothetical protein
MEANVKVNLDVSEIVNARIRAEVAEALGKDPAALINAVVDAALRVKKNSYDSETVFQKAINEMIAKAAEDAFGVWLKENEAIIEAAILRKMRDKPKLFTAKIVASVIEGLAKSFTVQAYMKME